MRLEIWIAIVTTAIPSIIAIIGIVIQYRSNQKQIQIMLAQINPTENVKPKEPINWMKVVLLGVYVCGLLWGLGSSLATFIFWLPASPRIIFLALLFNLWMLSIMFRNMKRVLTEWPWREAILKESDKV